MEGYVSKNEIKPYRLLFDQMLSGVRKEIRANGITFTCNLVGSAKRNLVIRHPNKGADCDYQLFIQSNKNNLRPEQIKRIFLQSFNKHLPNGFDEGEDSTSAVTIKQKDKEHSKIVFSFDIVIIRTNAEIPEILRRNKTEQYVWDILENMSGFQSRFLQIKGSKMWEELRKRYYKKKIRQMNGDDSRKSFQLLNEAVNETLQVFGQ
ncbi:hypothetical protein IKP13_08125 [bacterium]|nr:hypothetical protein [bacterium]